MLAVEKAKIDLSNEQVTVARKAELVPERHLSLEEEIDRGTFEREIMPLVVKSGTAIDEALKLRGLRPKDIDKVLLVGGTSKIPLVRRFVTEKLAGKEPEPFERVDPMTCVAQGAAIVAAILQGAPGLDNHAYSVKLEHSLCANPINERRQVYLDPIIRRGADIPCSFTKTYHPVADPADRVLISVYEGDVYDAPESPENVKLAEIPWEFQPPRPQREGALEVTFEYGDDGILTVQIFDPYGGHKKRFAIQQSGADQMDAAQIMKMKRINEDLLKRGEDLENSQEYKDALEVLKKTEQDVIPKVENAEDRRELEDLCRQVREAMVAGDKKRMEEASAALNDRLLNFAYLL
jgi:molecular chaperone DnaK